MKLVDQDEIELIKNQFPITYLGSIYTLDRYTIDGMNIYIDDIGIILISLKDNSETSKKDTWHPSIYISMDILYRYRRDKKFNIIK